MDPPGGSAGGAPAQMRRVAHGGSSSGRERWERVRCGSFAVRVESRNCPTVKKKKHTKLNYGSRILEEHRSVGLMGRASKGFGRLPCKVAEISLFLHYVRNSLIL